MIVPNQPLEMHRHDNPRAIIALKGGTLTVVNDAGDRREMTWETGSAYWLDADPPGRAPWGCQRRDRARRGDRGAVEGGGGGIRQLLNSNLAVLWPCVTGINFASLEALFGQRNVRTQSSGESGTIFRNQRDTLIGSPGEVLEHRH